MVVVSDLPAGERVPQSVVPRGDQLAGLFCSHRCRYIEPNIILAWLVCRTYSGGCNEHKTMIYNRRVIACFLDCTTNICYFACSIKRLFTLLDLCVSSLRRGHAILLCTVPSVTDDPRRESYSISYNTI